MQEIMMEHSFSETLEDYTVASRSNDEGRATALERKLLNQSADTARFVRRSAELDMEAGRIAVAAEKWAALSVLRPNDDGVIRQEINALTRQGDIDVGLRRIKHLDLLDAGFDHFYWGLNQYLRAGAWSAADELVANAHDRGPFSAAELTLANAVVLLETGMDRSAEKLLRELMSDATPGGQSARRLFARLMDQRGEYDLAAVTYGKLALDNGSMSDLAASVSFREMLLRYDVGIASIDDAVLRWPALKSSATILKDRLIELKSRAKEALVVHGPLQQFDMKRVLQWLQGGSAQSEILWARQALMSLADSAELPSENAEEYLRPFGGWEEWRVNRFVGLCYMRQCPDEPRFLHRYIRTVALDVNQRESLIHLLNSIPMDAMDEDMLVYGIHALRQLEHAVPKARQILAPAATELFEKIRVASAVAKPDFVIYARAQLSRLGISVSTQDLTPLTALVRNAIQQGAIFAISPWNTKIQRKKITSNQREASVVVALSGQMRGFERAWPSVHEYLVKPLRAPVALSLWDTSTNALGRHAKRLERVLPPDLLALLPPLERFTDVFQKKYPRSAAMVFDKAVVDPHRIESLVSGCGVREYLIETESEAKYEATIVANARLATHSFMKMFAKWHRMEQIISGLENDRGTLFTHVCWLRPDARITRFSSGELDRWIQDFETGWGEAVRPNMVGDYILFLPRRVFKVLSGIFPAAILSNGLDFLGWRQMPLNRFDRNSTDWPFGAPDTIAAALFAAGITLRDIRCVQIELLGYMPPDVEFRKCFVEEYESQTARVG